MDLPATLHAPVEPALEHAARSPRHPHATRGSADRRGARLRASSFVTGLLPTAYDSAWLASVPSVGEPHELAYPSALHWLLDVQHPDGSWGGSIRYEHDRILSTLAALAALGAAAPSQEARAAIASGTRYLWQRGHLLRSEPVELVGFELLLPALITRAERAGIAVPPHLDVYGRERAEKLRLLPAAALYSGRATVAHSLEYVGGDADPDGLRSALGANGSLGNSPAATAFLLTRLEDDRARAYLDACSRQTEGAAVPVLHPCETFELLWAAYHLRLAGVPAEQLLTEEECGQLWLELRQGGVSLSPTFPIPDADDTAVAVLLLHELGYDVDSSVLERFALPDRHFASFLHERHGSVGVNAHVLHALTRVPGLADRERATRHVLQYLRDELIDGLYWIDKWHISPYYATAHAICVLSELSQAGCAGADELIGGPLNWIRQTQNGDGSWGFYGVPTLEETALAVLALCAACRNADAARDRERCAAAIRYVRAEAARNHGYPGVALPPLWIDKCLYTPQGVVRAIIDAALFAFARAA